MGVKTFEELPDTSELPPPETRCCHTCMEHVGEFWLVYIHDDLTLWQYSTCWKCWHISLLHERPEDPRDARSWDRCQRYIENCREFSERQDAA